MRHCVSIIVCLSGALVLSADGNERGATSRPTSQSRPATSAPYMKYESGDDVLKAFRCVLDPYPSPSAVTTSMPKVEEFVWASLNGSELVSCLDSPVPSVRDEAARLLAQSQWHSHFSKSSFTKYLSRDYPLNVRVAALIRSMQSRGEAEGVSAAASGEQMKGKWTEVFNELVGLQTPPPYFAELMTLGYIEAPIAVPVKKENERLFVRRVLAITGRIDHSRLTSGLEEASFRTVSPAVVLDEIKEWLPSESDTSARVRLLWWVGSNAAAPELRGKAKKVLEWATKDWDEEVAETAKKELQSAGMQDTPGE